MTPPAASSGTCSKICCSATQRILVRHSPLNGAQDRESKGPEVSIGNWRNLAGGRVASPRVPSYADLRILWPNSS